MVWIAQSGVNLSILSDQEKLQYWKDIDLQEVLELKDNTTSREDLNAQKEKVRRLIQDHFRKIGIGTNRNSNETPRNLQKEQIRKIHFHSRIDYIMKNRDFIKSSYRKVTKFYANGSEISPKDIEPEVIEVDNKSIFSTIFRFSTLYWSIPVSRGFGRRMRFVIMDKLNWKVIGIIGLCSPVFNLAARDNWIGWTSGDRRERLTNAMDAFVLGALPPYSNLLCGKLIASLVATEEINRKYREKYKNKVSVITKKIHNPELILITTTSALGHSSLYDRIKINNRVLYNRVGSTKGFGHFHISDQIFEEMVCLLEMIDDKYAHGNEFGNGPNWRMRVIRKCLELLDMDQSLVNHGIRREIYCVPLAINFREYLKGETDKPEYDLFTLEEISEFCRQRWIIPRSKRNTSYLKVRKTFILEDLKRVMKDQNLLRWIE